MQLSSAQAHYWFILTAAVILIMLTLSVVAMLVLYSNEQAPPERSLFFSREFSWSDMSYPPEQFPSRQRHALAVFALSGIGYMVVVLGGILIGSILRWTRPGVADASTEKVQLGFGSSSIRHYLGRFWRGETADGLSDSSSIGHRIVKGPAPWLGGLLLISLLFMLNLTAIFTATTGMDLYGFYTLKPVSTQPLPLVLSTLLNLAMAAAGYACYRWLWRRQEWFTGGYWGPFARGAVLSGVPALLAHAPAIVLTSHGGKPTQIAVAGLIAGSLCIKRAGTVSYGSGVDPAHCHVRTNSNTDAAIHPHV